MTTETKKPYTAGRPIAPYTLDDTQAAWIVNIHLKNLVQWKDMIEIRGDCEEDVKEVAEVIVKALNKKNVLGYKQKLWVNGV